MNPLNKVALERAINDATLKIYRAKSHIDQIEAILESLRASDCYQILVYPDEYNPAEKDMLAVLPDDVPADIALCIGDAFHCLNVSFDYIITGLVRAFGADDNRVLMPAHDTRDALKKSFDPPSPGKTTPPNRRVVETVPGIDDFLLNDIQPYQGGDLLVWEIRTIDNIDKHNLIVPTFNMTYIEPIVAENQHGGVVTWRSQVLSGDIHEVISYYRDDPFEIKSKGNASVEVTFPEGAEVFAGDPVLPTMTQCHQLAAEVLDRFKGFCAPLLAA